MWNRPIWSKCDGQEHTFLSCTWSLFTVGLALLLQALNDWCFWNMYYYKASWWLQIRSSVNNIKPSHFTTSASNCDPPTNPQLQKLKYSLQPARLRFYAQPMLTCCNPGILPNLIPSTHTLTQKLTATSWLLMANIVSDFFQQSLPQHRDSSSLLLTCYAIVYSDLCKLCLISLWWTNGHINCLSWLHLAVNDLFLGYCIMLMPQRQDRLADLDSSAKQVRQHYYWSASDQEASSSGWLRNACSWTHQNGSFSFITRTPFSTARR